MIIVVIIMKDLLFLDQLFSDPTITITDMEKGLTNQNFLLHMNSGDYVLRIPREDSTHIVHRHHETLAIDALKGSGIDCDIIYYDEVSGYKVTRYLPDAQTYQECQDPLKIERVATLMKRFHGLHKHVDESFDPIARYHQYRNQVQHPLYDLTSYESILEQVAQLHNESILCHNDWVDGNILFTQDATYLIDYEYAANNDPLFDVMSFLSENQITDPQLRERFYAVYFDELDEQTRTHLAVWECFHNLLWCTWAMMMWEHRHEGTYQSIAEDKYQALKASYIEKGTH